MQNFGQAIANSFISAWASIIGFVPKLIAALIIFFIGWLVAELIAKLAAKVLQVLHVDAVFSRGTSYLTAGGIKLSLVNIISRIVFWFFMIIFLLAASNALGLTALSDFLRAVLLYIPNVFVAVIILLIAIQLAGFIRSIVQGSFSGAGTETAGWIGAIAWWAIVIFGIAIALVQLRIATSIINIVIGGIVAMIAIAGGIAFGLGGREKASHLLDRFSRRMPE